MFISASHHGSVRFSATCHLRASESLPTTPKKRRILAKNSIRVVLPRTTIPEWHRLPREQPKIHSHNRESRFPSGPLHRIINELSIRSGISDLMITPSGRGIGLLERRRVCDWRDNDAIKLTRAAKAMHLIAEATQWGDWFNTQTTRLRMKGRRVAKHQYKKVKARRALKGIENTFAVVIAPSLRRTSRLR